MVEIGLFPLELVLVPGERLPLHIFEPRYKELVGECLALEQLFGLVLHDEEGLRNVGTTAAVTDVLEWFDDGRMDIVVEGRERFRIVAETQGRSFRTAEVAPIADLVERPTAAELEACLVAYRGLAEEAGTEPDAPDPETASLAYWIAARVDLGTGVKQELLELLSERERTTRLTGLLGRASAAMRFSRTAHERASTNGRVEPP